MVQHGTNTRKPKVDNNMARKKAIHEEKLSKHGYPLEVHLESNRV